MKKNGGFQKIGVIVKPGLTTFEASLEQLRYKYHRKPLEDGRRDAHLSFESNFVQFGDL
jgi:hypothetical protein